MLRLVYRCLSSWVIKQAGLSRKTGQTGAVTLIQRFGSALNLNLHYHLLFLDGAYTQGDSHRLEFHLRSTGFHCKIGGADSEAESEPGALPWGFRSGRPSVEQPLA